MTLFHYLVDGCRQPRDQAITLTLLVPSPSTCKELQTISYSYVFRIFFFWDSISGSSVSCQQHNLKKKKNDTFCLSFKPQRFSASGIAHGGETSCSWSAMHKKDNKTRKTVWASFIESISKNIGTARKRKIRHRTESQLKASFRELLWIRNKGWLA